jgi:hypothetical protein
MIRPIFLSVAILVSAVAERPAVAQQQAVDGGYSTPAMVLPSVSYVQGTVSQPIFQSADVHGSGAVVYPAVTYASDAATYSGPIYSTAANGTFASYPSAGVSSFNTSPAAEVASSGLAQQKAQQMAQMSMRGHVGGGLGGASCEGVGWSTVSPQHAVQQCCYWGQRPASQIGVARGSDGCWYACVLYR